MSLIPFENNFSKAVDCIYNDKSIYGSDKLKAKAIDIVETIFRDTLTEHELNSLFYLTIVETIKTTIKNIDVE